MSERADLLELLLSPELVRALEEHMREVPIQAVHEELARQPQWRWLPLPEAAKELHCSPEALRMRVKRGTVEHHRRGRLLYVQVGTTDNGAEGP